MNKQLPPAVAPPTVMPHPILTVLQAHNSLVKGEREEQQPRHEGKAVPVCNSRHTRTQQQVGSWWTVDSTHRFSRACRIWIWVWGLRSQYTVAWRHCDETCGFSTITWHGGVCVCVCVEGAYPPGAPELHGIDKLLVQEGPNPCRHQSSQGVGRQQLGIRQQLGSRQSLC